MVTLGSALTRHWQSTYQTLRQEDRLDISRTRVCGEQDGISPLQTFANASERQDEIRAENRKDEFAPYYHR